MIVRRAVPGEAALLSGIAFEAKAHWGYPASALERWRPLLSLTPESFETLTVWVAEIDGQLAGFAAQSAVGRRARLDHLWIRPAFQRRGIGAALLREVMAEARRGGWTALEIESDPHAEGFYLAQGARRIGENAGDLEGHPRSLPVLELDLSPAPASEILLATLNAKYIHASFGLRYLMANLGELRSRAVLREFDINQKPVDVAEAILAGRPRIVGLGVYIWNVAPTTELVAILKRANPDLIIVLGGPEVSYETECQEIVRLADHVITGEADLKFAEICRHLLQRDRSTLPKVIVAELPNLAQVELPYDFYGPEDAAHRVIYVEASRGCPFTCEFCLSSLDIPVRQFPLDRFLGAMQSLLDRGVTQFKFVDRTFNLHLPTSRAILKFFLDRWRPGLFVHFEMVPDRLPGELRDLIRQFPPGALQFEVGIQTFNPEVEALISRRQDHARLEENFRWLRQSSGVHVHADLIAGLPGESLGSFAQGFDRLLALDPQEIQVGILKRLRGTPIVRHDSTWGLLYNPHPPYEVLQTRLLDFDALAKLRRFAKFWDLFGNSGNFAESRQLLLESPAAGPSPFWRFWRFADWLHARGVKTSGIALMRQFELLSGFLQVVAKVPDSIARPALQRDYRRGGRTDLPGWLAGDLSDSQGGTSGGTARQLPRRQARHAAAPSTE